MRAITVLPGTPKSARLDDIPEPRREDGPLLIQGVALGICGTDREILGGEYGEAPPGRERLVLGHESLGRVLEAPAGAPLRVGDLVVGIVRRPDPVPCPNCAAGEWDMCQNGRYTEHGIKGLDGFGSERYRVEPDAAVPVDAKLGLHGVLLEPASIVAKAWDHIECIGRRARFEPRSVLITGAGPIGLLAALLGAQRGLKVHVLDRNKEGPKPRLVRDLGGTYHPEELGELSREADIVIECTGAPAVIFGAIEHARPNGIVCLTGVSSGGMKLPIDVGAINRELVLENNVVFGTVNANRKHYEQGAAALAAADPGWLDRLITRRVPLDKWHEALEKRPGDVKTVVLLG